MTHFATSQAGICLSCQHHAWQSQPITISQMDAVVFNDIRITLNSKGILMTDQPTYTIMIASYLEPEYVARIRAVSPRLRVLYEPELMAPPRYHADHYNLIVRTPEQEARWRELLGQADIQFDLDPTHRADLP